MRKQILILAIMAHGAFTNYAHADEWTGQDKTLHFLGGAAVGAAVTIATNRRDYGLAAGISVGLVKELYDAQHRVSTRPASRILWPQPQAQHSAHMWAGSLSGLGLLGTKPRFDCMPCAHSTTHKTRSAQSAASTLAWHQTIQRARKRSSSCTEKHS